LPNDHALVWDRQAFVEQLRAVGESRYHDRHPFHRRMNGGGLTREQVRGWVANRFYYQRNIPIKDAAILSNCPLPEVRRVWVQRLLDHDGQADGQGGIEAWLRLAEAVGLRRDETLDGRHLLPGVRFAVDAYVEFARREPWPVAVASSLTELFAPDLMAERLRAFEKHYSWVAPSGLAYFRARLTQARRDAGHALDVTLTHCTTPDLRAAAVRALAFKCDVLWAMLDALEMAYGVSPGQGPRPSEERGGVMGEEDRPRLAAKVRLQTDRVGGGPVLLYPEAVLVLNPTAAAVVALCDGSRTAVEIAAALAERYAAPADLLAADVAELLGRLRDQGLLYRPVPGGAL
jgi:pyrroloquinoline-quinone synthase